MKYTVNGKLHAAICDGLNKGVANTKIKLFAYQQEVNETTAFASAQSKEITQLLEGKNRKTKNDHYLGEATTKTDGSYELNFDANEKNYAGGAVLVVLDYEEVPDYGQGDTKPPKGFRPFQIVIDVLQPKWRKSEVGALAKVNLTLSHKIYCYILKLLDIWVICGTVLNCESGAALSGIEVIAMDDDIITDDLLGSAVTDGQGKFCIYYRSIDFKKTFLSPWINIETTPIFSFDNGPDIYFKFAVGGNEFFAESPSEAQKPSRKNVGNCLCVSLCLKDVAPDPDPDPPAAFYEIGYARRYHPVLNIDPATGRTTGKATASFNEQAFFGTMDLRGSLSEELNGQKVEYKFQYAEVADPTVDIATIPVWTDVIPTDIANSVIGSRLTTLFPFPQSVYYAINAVGGQIDVPVNANWIEVPQSPGPFPIAFNGSLIKLISSKLASSIVDKAGFVAGNSSAPLEKNRYFALRMFKREAGNAATEELAGFSRPLAIFNTKYKDVPQGGTWDLLGKSTELGLATVDIQELVDGGSCAKIDQTLTVNYTAANPNLGVVTLNMYGPGGPHNFEPLTITTPGEEVNGQTQYTGANAIVEPTDVSSLPNCAFEVRLSAELNLTNGEVQHHTIWDRVLYCKQPIV